MVLSGYPAGSVYSAAGSAASAFAGIGDHIYDESLCDRSGIRSSIPAGWLGGSVVARFTKVDNFYLAKAINERLLLRG